MASNPSRVKKIFAIQIVNSIITGILTIALPLLMKERDVSIVQMGLIFSLMPIIFQLTRLSFGVLSDFLGRKIFLVFNSVLAVLSNITYYFAYSPLSYASGKIAEGVKDGSLWAVNRASVLDEGREMRWRLVQLRTFSSLFEAVGNITSGFLIAWLLFSNTILLTVAMSAILVPISFSLSQSRRSKLNFSEIVRSLDFRNRTPKFKKFLVLFFTSGISDGFIAGYVFTMFLSQNGMNTELIGAVLGVRMLIAGVCIYFFIRIKITKLLVVGGATYALSLSALGFSNLTFAGLLLLLSGVAYGARENVSERFFPVIVRSGMYASDVGLLMTSFHTARTCSILASGFLIASYGFSSVFLLSSLACLVYVSMAYGFLRKEIVNGISY